MHIGKSFFIKGEIENTVLNNPCDQIIVFDRAGEYATLTKANDGSEVTLAVSSKTYMNPFGFDDVAHLSRREQIAFKIDAILAQACANAAESGEGLGDGDRSLIARCVELCYEQAKKTGPDAMPTLGDFRDVLIRQPEERAGEIALKYEMYTSGALSFFNNQTNIDFTKKLIDINFRELPDSMLVFALINTCEVVRNRMYYNHSKGVRTHLYIEEIQSMFRYETVINYFSRFAKEGRKFGLLLTGITQNSIAMLEHKTARDIVANASFIALLQQSQVDRRAWSDLMGLSAMEEQYIDETNAAGDGLLLFGPKKIPFRGDFPKGTVLYELFDTDPNEVRGR
jgi:type IV secretory pathway VirB4 component